MRIDGNGRIGTTQGPTVARRSEGAEFRLPGTEAARDAAPLRNAAALTGLDSMLALQSVEDPLMRRRKAIKRGKKLLDVLDAMKIALLDGVPGGDDAARLAEVLRETREGAGDPGLDDVLDQIELRAAVEMAKRRGSKI
jgi:hypothetical protein